MELQAVTASAAVGIARAVIALFMFGMYLAARRDTCTAYWTISATLVAIGSMVPLYTSEVGQFGIWFASVTVISGGVSFWWGLSLFFGRGRSILGWWIIGGIAVSVGVMLLLAGSQTPRLLAFTGAVVIGVSLIIREAWRGDGTPLTVGRAMVVGAYALVAVGQVVRAAYFTMSGTPVSPVSDHPVNVILLYLVPLMTSILASVGALLMYFQRTVAQKEHLANHDDLTRIYNRRALADAGRRALAAERGSVAVLLVDVDHFKTVNDTMGHETGDAVLAAIADTLSRNCRLTDIIGRLGGEEFCIVCPDTEPAEAQILANRLLAAVADLQPPGQMIQPLSVSIGIAAAAHGAWDALLGQADRALYAAKAAGRGQAMVA